MTVDLIHALQPLLSRVRTDITAIKHGINVGWKKDEPLTEERLKQHLNGGVARGVCPIKEGEYTTKVGLLDFDSHNGETSWEDMTRVALVIMSELMRRGMKPILFRSFGGRGIHLFLLWDTAQDAHSIRELLREVIEVSGYKNGTKGVAAKEIEIFPKQNLVPKGGCGNQFILPLAGKSVPLDPVSLEPLAREAISPLSWTLSPAVPKCEPPIRKKSTTQSDNDNKNLTVLREMLAFIDPDIGRDDWIKIGMAIHYETDGSSEGLSLWDEWSSGRIRNNGEEGSISYGGLSALEYQWRSFKKEVQNPVTAATVKKYAREAGWKDVSALEEFADVDSVYPHTTDRFAVMSADDFANGVPPKWIVDGVLPETGSAMVIGVSGSGKTFLVMDMMASIALGRPWRGRKVKRGRVMYIAAEGAGGVRKRLKAYKDHYKVSFGRSLGVISDTPNLLQQDDIALAESINRYGGAAVIVIDTLAQVTSGADENTSSDMGKALSRCKALQAATGALIILVHHIGKDASRGARGWSGMKGAMDTEIEVGRNGDARYAKITKQKDGEEGKIFPFNLMPVVIGVDEEFRDITSCVVNHIEDSTKVKGVKPQGKWQEAVYKAVVALTSSEHTHHPVERVIDEAIRTIPHDPGPDQTNPKRDKRRYTAERALGEISKELLNLKDNTVCLTQCHEPPQCEFCDSVARPSMPSQMPHDSKGVWQCGADADSGAIKKGHSLDEYI